jgi:ACS family glucarate transporter-like MFS transporter
MNTAGNLGGVVSMNAFPLLQGLTGSGSTYFFVAAVLNILALLCWRGMSSQRAADPATYPAPSATLREAEG